MPDPDDVQPVSADTEWVDWEPPEPISSPPPAETLDWIEDELGSTVVDVLALPGGLSSAIHRIELVDGRAVVLRRYVLADWMEREPHIPHDEAQILDLLATFDLPVETPSLILADPGGERDGTPAIVMSEVPGRPDLQPLDPGAWAERQAETLAAIHAVDPAPLADELRPWKRWDSPDRPIPTWTADPDLWRRAIDEVPTDLPTTGEPRFLHRDYHPNNLHWSNGELVAVVDWLSACLGEPAADLAHCRWNLAVLVGPEMAFQFTWHYEELTGAEVDTLPYDLATVLSAPVGPFPLHAWHGLGRTDLTQDEVAKRIDGWLAHLLES